MAWRCAPCSAQPRLPQLQPRLLLRCSAVANGDASLLRAKDLRAVLLANGVPVEGLFDKEALLAAVTALRRSHSRGVDTPLLWREAASLHNGVQTSQGSHAAMQADGAGVRLCFVLDTAASSSCVTPQTAAQLRLARTGVAAELSVSGTGAATAQAYQVTLGTLHSVPRGQLLVENQRAVVIDLPTGGDTAGILGASTREEASARSHAAHASRHHHIF